MKIKKEGATHRKKRKGGEQHILCTKAPKVEGVDRKGEKNYQFQYRKETEKKKGQPTEVMAVRGEVFH